MPKAEVPKPQMPPEVRRIYTLAGSLGAMPPGASEALNSVLDEFFENSRAAAVDPDLPEEKRAGACGEHYAITDLRAKLKDLMGAGWQSWPQVKGWREMTGGEEGE